MNSDASNIVAIPYCHFCQLIFAFFTLCDVTDDPHGFFWIIGFLSITFDQIEIERREKSHCDDAELPNRLITDLAP